MKEYTKRHFDFPCQYCKKIVTRSNTNLSTRATCFDCRKQKAKERLKDRTSYVKDPLYKCITCNDHVWNEVRVNGEQCGFCKKYNYNKIC